MEPYDRDLERAEAHIALVAEGKMREEDFVTTHPLSQPPFSSIEDLRPHGFIEPHSITHPSQFRSPRSLRSLPSPIPPLDSQTRVPNSSLFAFEYHGMKYTSYALWKTSQSAPIADL